MSSSQADLVRTMIRRGQILAYDATGPQHILRVAGVFGEELDQVVRAKDHGFSSSPPIGSDALLLAMGGAGNRVMAVGVDNQCFGPRNLNPGESALYDHNGNMVSCVTNAVRIVSGTQVVIVAPTIVLDGVVHLGGTGGVPAAMQGTVDTAGNADVGNLATKVFVT